MFKSNKGVTLVALVITIIVLLILAGVSISLIAGPNGVLTKSKKAAKDTDIANVKDAFELAVAGVAVEYQDDSITNLSLTAGNYFTYARIKANLDGYQICSATSTTEETTGKLEVSTDASSKSTIYLCKKGATSGATIYKVEYLMSDAPAFSGFVVTPVEE